MWIEVCDEYLGDPRWLDLHPPTLAASLCTGERVRTVHVHGTHLCTRLAPNDTQVQGSASRRAALVYGPATDRARFVHRPRNKGLAVLTT